MTCIFLAKIIDFLIEKNIIIILSLLAILSFNYAWSISFSSAIIITIIAFIFIKKNSLLRLPKKRYFQLTILFLISISYLVQKYNVLLDLLKTISSLVNINPILIISSIFVLLLLFLCLCFKKIHKIILLFPVITLIVQLLYIPLFSYTMVKEQQSYIDFYEYFNENDLKPTECSTGEIVCFMYSKDIISLPQKMNNINDTVKNEMTCFLTNLANKIESSQNSFVSSFPSNMDMYLGVTYIPYAIYNSRSNFIIMDFKTPPKIFNTNFDFYTKIVLIALKFWFIFGYLLILFHINVSDKKSAKLPSEDSYEIS